MVLTLQCPLCRAVVIEGDVPAGAISAPIVMRARCHNRKRCPRPMIRWQVTPEGRVLPLSLDKERLRVLQSA